MNKTQTAPESVRILERMLHEGFAAGNTGIVDELCSPNLVEHQFGFAGTGPDAIEKVKQGIADVHRGMPDLRFSVENWAENGDIAWIQAVGEGTNTGPFMGPPTGKPVRLTVIDIARMPPNSRRRCVSAVFTRLIERNPCTT